MPAHGRRDDRLLRRGPDHGHYAKPEAVASARTHQIEANLDPRKFRAEKGCCLIC
jgi:hypothetical protein